MFVVAGISKRTLSCKYHSILLLCYSYSSCVKAIKIWLVCWCAVSLVLTCIAKIEDGCQQFADKSSNQNIRINYYWSCNFSQTIQFSLLIYNFRKMRSIALALNIMLRRRHRREHTNRITFIMYIALSNEIYELIIFLCTD